MVCPRCDADKGELIFEAPKDRSWELYRCADCSFIWRSTEPESIKNAALYNPDFKLNKERMNNMLDRPAIPPLGKK